MVKTWERFCIFSKMMDRSFEYLNRYYLKNNKLPTTGERCQVMFKEMIYKPAKEKIVAALMVEIQKQRDAQMVNRENIKAAIQVFVDMGLVKPKPMRTKEGIFVWQGDRHLQIYDDDFECVFLHRTQEYFSGSARRWN